MRHNFVNDIGDYAKYALLRAICLDASEAVQLGVIWYLTDHEIQNGDGRKRAHLTQDGWETLDPDLLRQMRQIESKVSGQGELSISLIEAVGILPSSTAYFSEPVPGTYGTGAERVKERNGWFGRAKKAMEGCNVIFLDPDNGLEVRSAPLTSPLATRYATVREMSELLENNAAVILYQHGTRTAWESQRQDVCGRIAAGSTRPTTIRTLRFGAFGVRAFFCVTTSANMAEVIDTGLDQIRRRTENWAKENYLLFQ
jgi:hypothetical protein